MPLYNDLCQKELDEVMSSQSFSEFIALYNKYLEFLRERNETLSNFWMSYIDIIKILLDLLTASKRGRLGVASISH